MRRHPNYWLFNLWFAERDSGVLKDLNPLDAIEEIGMLLNVPHIPGWEDRRGTLRITVNDDGTVNILDFAIPPDTQKFRKGVPQNEVPTWIMETISMLRITNDREVVPDLGFKISDTVYYILDRTGEDDGRPEDTETN